MCGFVGYFDLKGERGLDRALLEKMTSILRHRGPDADGFYRDRKAGFGFRRLSILDLEGSDQPIPNEDGSAVMMCNGEIYNYRDLRAELAGRGHRFRTAGDAEVVIHLYEEAGPALVERLNGQFALAVYDRTERRLLLARDHFGIQPLFYTVADGYLLFASEVKALLEHPAVRREVDLTCMDQIFTFPGPVSPRSLFKDVHSLPNGHYLVADAAGIRPVEYWDLDYPLLGEPAEERPESFWAEELRQRFADSVEYRLQGDVPIGLYLSGGLDSSFTAAMVHHLTPEVPRHSFSITFPVQGLSEKRYQTLMAGRHNGIHHEIPFDADDIAGGLREMTYHAECMVKETYNTCSMALSRAAREQGVKAVLTAEGSDELFAGYVGYKFDRSRLRGSGGGGWDDLQEDRLREELWGDPDLFYEKHHHAYGETLRALYSAELGAVYDEFSCLRHPVVDKERLRGRHPINQRSYLDFKLRLCDHLLADHGDRMAMANSIEARYPFLDIRLVDFARRIPPEQKLNGYQEKYVVKQAARGLLPEAVLRREKFEFRGPSSPYLLQRGPAWVRDLLSYDRIRRQGYFNPDVVERLKTRYSREGFTLHFPFEDDLLILVLTFNLFLDVFQMPGL